MDDPSPHYEPLVVWDATQPPVESLGYPASLEADPGVWAGRNALRDFTPQIMDWRSKREPLSARVTVATGLLGLLNLLLACWLVAVLNGSFPCDDLLCSWATFGGHPLLTLIVSGASLSALVVLAVPTRGFTRAGLPDIAVLVVAAVAALAAIAGAIFVIVLLVALGVCALLILLIVVAGVSESR